MLHNSVTAIFKTVSGLVGCVGKAVTAMPLLLAITLPNLTNVVLYAAASDTVGYVVKKAIECISEKLNKFFKENFNDHNKKGCRHSVTCRPCVWTCQAAENAECI